MFLLRTAPCRNCMLWVADKLEDMRFVMRACDGLELSCTCSTSEAPRGCRVTMWRMCFWACPYTFLLCRWMRVKWLGGEDWTFIFCLNAFIVGVMLVNGTGFWDCVFHQADHQRHPHLHALPKMLPVLTSAELRRRSQDG